MAGNRPLISVNLVTYNHEKYIGNAIQSVLAQTCPDFELIVVDDGSTDGTWERIRSFRDPRLVPIRQENQGPSAATNRGLAVCRGQYVASMSGDDTCRLDRLQKQLDEYRKGGRRVLFSQVDFIDEEGMPLAGQHFADQFFTQTNLSRAQVLARLFYEGNWFNSITTFTERAVLGDGFNPLLLQLQDFEMWIRLAKQYDLCTIPEPLVRYRIRQGNQNLSCPDVEKQIASSNEHYLIMRHFFNGMPADLFREAFRDQLRNPTCATEQELACEQAFLYLNSPYPLNKLIGLERLFEIGSRPAGARLLQEQYAFTPVRFMGALRDANVMNLFIGHESKLYVDAGRGLNEEDVLRKKANLRLSEFQQTFDLSAYPAVRLLRWDPMEDRFCKVKIEAITCQDDSGQTREIALSTIRANGLRLNDGTVVFENFDPGFVIPVEGPIRKVTIRGKWEHEEMREALEKFAKLLDVKEHQLQRILASRSWRLLAPVRYLGQFFRGEQAA